MSCLIISSNDYFGTRDVPSYADIQKGLESSKISKKVTAMEDLIVLMSSASSSTDSMISQWSKMLMTVIRFVVSADDDHKLKKLTLLFWELVEKVNRSTGELKEEMLLVCNALLQDLQHPNEYVRALTMKLLCNIPYLKIIEPLVETVLKNLSHRHVYVRRHSVMCLFAFYQNFGNDLFPHLYEEIDQMLFIESDPTTRRNLFVLMSVLCPQRATEYCIAIAEDICDFDDSHSLVGAILNFAMGNGPSKAEKAELCEFFINIVESSEFTHVDVKFAICLYLLTLYKSKSTMGNVLSSSIKGLVTILRTCGDSAIKLRVMGKLRKLCELNDEVFSTELSKYILDILMSIDSTLSLEVRRSVLDICLGVGSSEDEGLTPLVYFVQDEGDKIMSDIVSLIQRQLTGEKDDASYRELLVNALVKINSLSDTNSKVSKLLPIFLDLLTEVTPFSSALKFIQDQLRFAPDETMISLVIEGLVDIQDSTSLRIIIHSVTCAIIDLKHEKLAIEFLTNIINILKPFPIISTFEKKMKETTSTSTQSNTSNLQTTITRTVILEDGTYGTETVNVELEVEDEPMKRHDKMSNLKRILFNLYRKTDGKKSNIIDSQKKSEQLLINVLSLSLSRLLVLSKNMKLYNEVLYVVLSILKIDGGKSVDILDSVKILKQLKKGDVDVESVKPTTITKPSTKEQHQVNSTETTTATSQSNSFNLWFRQIDSANNPTYERSSSTTCEISRVLELSPDLGGSINMDEYLESSDRTKNINLTESLSKAESMTGSLDPLYIEGLLSVASYDLKLDLTIYNRHPDEKMTLQNIYIDLCTTNSDLKVLNSISEFSLGPGQFTTKSVHIKVNSTESATVFGYLSFNEGSSSDKTSYMTLGDVSVDVKDFIKIKDSKQISHEEFKKYWSEFEWENKISIGTNILNFHEYVDYLCYLTNFSRIGESMGINNELPFYSENLHGQTIYGEDCLLNVSADAEGDELNGSIRIRSRTQGIALSIGDKISAKQRK